MKYLICALTIYMLSNVGPITVQIISPQINTAATPGTGLSVMCTASGGSGKYSYSWDVNNGSVSGDQDSDTIQANFNTSAAGKLSMVTVTATDQNDSSNSNSASITIVVYKIIGGGSATDYAHRTAQTGVWYIRGIPSGSTDEALDQTIGFVITPQVGTVNWNETNGSGAAGSLTSTSFSTVFTTSGSSAKMGDYAKVTATASSGSSSSITAGTAKILIRTPSSSSYNTDKYTALNVTILGGSVLHTWTDSVGNLVEDQFGSPVATVDINESFGAYTALYTLEDWSANPTNGNGQTDSSGIFTDVYAAPTSGIINPSPVWNTEAGASTGVVNVPQVQECYSIRILRRFNTIGAILLDYNL